MSGGAPGLKIDMFRNVWNVAGSLVLHRGNHIWVQTFKGSHVGKLAKDNEAMVQLDFCGSFELSGDMFQNISVCVKCVIFLL